jgi:hypothetical protein
MLPTGVIDTDALGEGVYVFEMRRRKVFYGVALKRGEVVEIDSGDPMQHERLRRMLAMVGPPAGIARLVTFRPSTSDPVLQNEAEPAIADA